jgi:hypothetical protein
MTRIVKMNRKAILILLLILIILFFIAMPDIPRAIEGKIETFYWDLR